MRDQSPAETITTTEEATEPVVSSSQPEIKVSLSGQVNRAINFANDGDSTKAYFVDNDVSNSRFRVLGLANYNEDVRFGGLLEVAFSPNNSSDVSQDNEDAGDLIDVRRAETGVDSKRLGRLWLGEGSAATDNVAEYDLSGIDVIMYAGVADIVGGLQFTEDGDLTGLTVADAFFDFDGDRQNRVRYDTPVFGPGLQFSASAGSDQRYDASLNWGGDFDQWSGVELGPFTTLAAIGISDPSENGVDYRLMGSGSVLHNPTGLNLTVSSGMDQADEGDPYNLYGKLGWYGTLNTLGNTGFGVDFTRGHDVSAPGDTGYSVGGAVVQTIEGYGTELYSQVRWYTLDGDDAERRRHRGRHARHAGEVLMCPWLRALCMGCSPSPWWAPACRSGRPTRRATIPRSRRARACSPARPASWSSSAAEEGGRNSAPDMPQTMRKRNSHDRGPDHA